MAMQIAGSQPPVTSQSAVASQSPVTRGGHSDNDNPDYDSDNLITFEVIVIDWQKLELR